MSERTPSITWPYAVIVLIVVGLALAGTEILSASRAYIGGQRHWSKAERDASAHLIRYGASHLPSDYRRFREALAIPGGARRGREARDAKTADPRAAYDGFLSGRNHPDDIPRLIRLFRLSRNLPFMRDMIEQWAKADEWIDRLAQVLERLPEEIRSGSPEPGRIPVAVAEVRTIHEAIVPLENRFAQTLDDLARLVTRIVHWMLIVGAMMLVVLGSAITRRMHARTAAVSRALHASERRVRAEQAQLRHQANHDALTGLANRRHFEERLQEVLSAPREAGRSDAVLYLDLDQFKVVNDTCGHPAGDELIRQLSGRLRGLLRRSDTLARLGGDEFGVLLEHCDIDAAQRRAEVIRREVAQFRFAWQVRTFSVGASIGVVTLDGSMSTVAEVMSAADRACYAAKDKGRDRVHLFRLDDLELQARAGEMEWVARIARALENDSLVLHSQEIRPLRAAADGGPTESHLELLVRIVDEDGSLVLPMAFIPAAERYGLMPRIDRWVIARAFSELRALRDRSGTIPRCMINLSGGSVADPSLLAFITDRFAESGLPFDRIGFELTETAAISNMAVAKQLMRELRALGCPLALDDFGAGMSSFAYLRTLPIDYLKIDGHIVKDLLDDPVNRAMIHAIRQVAEVMGVHTIAEWVENGRMVEELGRLGIDYVQGYGVARPLRLADALADWQARPPLPRPLLTGQPG